MSAYVCELACRFLYDDTDYNSADCHRNCMCALLVLMRVDPFSSQSKHQLVT